MTLHRYFTVECDNCHIARHYRQDSKAKAGEMRDYLALAGWTNPKVYTDYCPDCSRLIEKAIEDHPAGKGKKSAVTV